MVDFNNETTVTAGSTDVVKIIRLEKRYNLFEALETYYKNTFLGIYTGDELGVVRARALNLFFEMEGELTRKKSFKKQNRDLDFDIDELKRWLTNGKADEVFDAISIMNLFLDDIGLTKIDTKKRIDTTRVEYENKERKL